jgi:FlaA1/EpsC-like NDP-sugar epimerase
VFIIDGVLLLLLLGLTRGSFRLISEFVLRRRSVGRRCAIYGTANGLATIQEAVRDAPLRIIGFIDDNALNRKMRVGGYSVLGGYETLRALIEIRALDCVIVNTPLVDVERLAALETACRNADVELLRLHVNLQPLSSVS